MTGIRQPDAPSVTRRAPRHGLLVTALLVLVVLLVATAFLAGPRLLGNRDAGLLSTDGWPAHGQGAYALGDSAPAVSPQQRSVPIASVAKVMTAYVVLRRLPLASGENGRTFVVGRRDVEDTRTRHLQGQSIVPLHVGEHLSERDALMAILLPSANNVAVLVARDLDGSVEAFVDEMNRTAHDLGMSNTRYTDPSGYDERTVSTAFDQLRLAKVAAGNATLASMTATRSYSLPVAGVVRNTDTLLGHDGFVGIKTGSDSAAGGCFMFRAVRRTAHGRVTLIGVVLGQPGKDLIAAGLASAQLLADRVAPIGPAGPSR